MRKTLFYLACVFVLIQVSSCGETTDPEPSGEQFDKTAMLTQIADSVIVPAYDEFDQRLFTFRTSFNLFRVNPTDQSLSEMRATFAPAYAAWQACSPFEIGPSALQGLRLTVNTFPVDSARVRDLITSTDYDLSNAQNAAAKGLPALDYILFGLEDSILATDLTIEFIDVNLSIMEDALEAVRDEWSARYRDEFIASTGSDVGSSLGQLVNALNFEFELIKNAKVGIPLGKKTLGVIQPEKVEALYSASSLALVSANLESIKRTFTGGQGKGIDDYLDALDARYGEQLLSEAIVDGFDSCLDAAKALEGPLDELISNAPSGVEELHTRLQSQVVLLKTDMPSQLGVQITYQDNDGD